VALIVTWRTDGIASRLLAEPALISTLPTAVNAIRWPAHYDQGLRILCARTWKQAHFRNKPVASRPPLSQSCARPPATFQTTRQFLGRALKECIAMTKIYRRRYHRGRAFSNARRRVAIHARNDSLRHCDERPSDWVGTACRRKRLIGAPFSRVLGTLVERRQFATGSSAKRCNRGDAGNLWHEGGVLWIQALGSPALTQGATARLVHGAWHRTPYRPHHC